MLLSILAGILELIASYILGSKNKIGWLITIIVDLIWIYIGFIYTPVMGVWIVCIPDLIISIRNYLLWKEEEEQDRQS